MEMGSATAETQARSARRQRDCYRWPLLAAFVALLPCVSGFGSSKVCTRFEVNADRHLHVPLAMYVASGFAVNVHDMMLQSLSQR